MDRDSDMLLDEIEIAGSRPGAAAAEQSRAVARAEPEEVVAGAVQAAEQQQQQQQQQLLQQQRLDRLGQLGRGRRVSGSGGAQAAPASASRPIQQQQEVYTRVYASSGTPAPQQIRASATPQQQQQQQPGALPAANGSTRPRSKTPLRRSGSGALGFNATPVTGLNTPATGLDGCRTPITRLVTPVTSGSLRGIAGGAPAALTRTPPILSLAGPTRTPQPGRLSILDQQLTAGQDQTARADQGGGRSGTPQRRQQGGQPRASPRYSSNPGCSGSNGSGADEGAGLEPNGGGAATATPVPPVKWSSEDVKKWVCEVGGGKFRGAASALPASVDGKALSRFPEVS